MVVRIREGVGVEDWLDGVREVKEVGLTSTVLYD